ncbi:MAG TPA: glycosyltransferase family 2 protein [Syntrophales bacterium]|nr:glycosyltransferase family 2 protein [Syntrophales bacterium]
MKKLTAVVPFIGEAGFERTIITLVQSELIEKIVIVSKDALTPPWPRCSVMRAGSITAGDTLNRITASAETGFLLFVTEPEKLNIPPPTLGRFVEVAEATDSGMVYSDHLDLEQGILIEHPVNDYQLGSIRDGFDFGCLTMFSLPAVRRAFTKYGPILDVLHAGLYDLRLKVSIDHHLFHIQEYLYTKNEADAGADATRHERRFGYVDQKNMAVQKEMERVATSHLRNIGAFLEPHFTDMPGLPYSYPVEASVIIPVRNRVKTVAEAVESALSQETDFSRNIIVVDNHSSDGTSEVLAELAGRNPAVKHIIPARLDLNIGGCWNEAIFSEFCGRYSVQLDSDDLYQGPGTLQKIVDIFRNGNFAMVIGSYTLVDEHLNAIPPGVVDHREWTDENGRNNALRIDGFGAPRAFDTGIIRGIGFLNVGYGEDYAMALRLSRDYRLGRIYESLYLCRRWAGNTDARIPVEEANRFDAFKDKIRTLEIMARRKMRAK